MKKAFFINGGAGRVLCALPALEYYATNIDPDVIIIAESWTELFVTSPILRNNVYPPNHKDIYKLLQDRELISPEPYRLNAYFNQKCNLIQAFDMLINTPTDLETIPATKDFNLDIGKADQIYGYNFVQQAKQMFNKDKVVIFQPFGSAIKQNGSFIYDESGRSFEVEDVITIIDELSKYYAVILMTQIQPQVNRQVPAIIPENVNLLQWLGILHSSDYFLGCDSVGQHMANSLDKPTTVVIGSTFPENISYPNNPKFNIIDNGKLKRKYSPIRITSDLMIERNNEHLMILEKDTIKQITDSVKNKLGTTSTSTCTSKQCSSKTKTEPFIPLADYKGKK